MKKALLFILALIPLMVSCDKEYNLSNETTKEIQDRATDKILGTWEFEKLEIQRLSEDNNVESDYYTYYHYYLYFLEDKVVTYAGDYSTTQESTYIFNPDIMKLTFGGNVPGVLSYSFSFSNRTFDITTLTEDSLAFCTGAAFLNGEREIYSFKRRKGN